MTQLDDKAIIREEPFESGLPLVATIRNTWNNVAARWHVQKMFRQQIEFNLAAARRIEAQNEQLIAQDRQLVELTRTVADLERQLKRLRQHSAETNEDRLL